MSISAVVLTNNSEKTLGRCLKSISFADEIIVIDDGSIDSTIKIAKKYNSKVYKRKLNSDFASQRNFGLSKTKSDWVLFLDSDEKFIGGKPMVEDQYDGYQLRRIDVFMGKKIKYGEPGGKKILVLAKKTSGKWQRHVHECWNIRGRVGNLENYILHYSHPSVYDFISKINFYAIIHQSENKKEGKKPSLLKVFFFPVFKFINSFIVKRGFLDGAQGFVYAAMMSFHSFLVWGSLWLKKR